MKCLNYIIVSIDKAYDNEVQLGNSEFIVNSTIENVEFVNRTAKVVSSPSFTILQEGDEVVVHHNIFRLRNGVNGELVPSNFHLEGNTYFVPLTEVFMYKRNGVWNAIEPFCFIKPIDLVLDDSEFSVSLNESSHKGKVKNTGLVRYINPYLKDQGLKEGDKVIFSNYSEYEFNIEGHLYYKMSNKDILGVL